MRIFLAVLGMCITSASFSMESYGGQPFHGSELHRVMIHNVAGGEIQGSRDSGKSWSAFGHILTPIKGSVWYPTTHGNQVMAYNYLRGPSNVFATAVNAVHLRFSDPPGYQLSTDLTAELPIPKGVSILPKEGPSEPMTEEERLFTAITDIPGGTLLFGPEWSPRVASRVLMGDGKTFAPLPYEYGPNDTQIDRSYLLIITQGSDHEIEYLDFENRLGGVVTLKPENRDPIAVARVDLAVEGIGRFTGSEVLPRPGTIRANHAGVFDIGTTDIKLDPLAPKTGDLSEWMGGFQVVPSFHWKDPSMLSGGDHPFVYMVVSPLIAPDSIQRYDQGVEGSYPLFFQGVRAGMGRTQLQFKGSEQWYEMGDAVKLGKFKRRDGTVVQHLRGYIKDALIEVTRFRFYPNG